MGCGAFSSQQRATEEDQKRDEVASKIQTTFCDKADQELKLVVDSASSIVQRLGNAVRGQDEAAIRYELVQIQKLSPPTIALVRAHAGGRTIKLPNEAAQTLVADISASLEVGSGTALGTLIATERILKVFSWFGHRPDQSGDLVADDAGSWELDLDGDGRGGAALDEVWLRLKVQSAIGKLLEVLPEKRWRIDTATVALQELKEACTYAGCGGMCFDADRCLQDIVFPQIEVEFGQGTQWERNALERMQVLLAATFHLGGDEALLKLLEKASNLIVAKGTDVPEHLHHCHYLMLWDGLLRCAQHLRPSLFRVTREDMALKASSYVRVIGNTTCPELNGFFGAALPSDIGVVVGKVPPGSADDFASFQIGHAVAKVPLGTLARPDTVLDKAVSTYASSVGSEIVGFLRSWLAELCDVADANDSEQPGLAPAMSSQFASTTDRVVCGVCSTFMFSIDERSLDTCVACGSCVKNRPPGKGLFAFDKSPSLSGSSFSTWQCPKCNESFECWEDEGDEDGLLSHLRETGHAPTKGGKNKFRKVHLLDLRPGTELASPPVLSYKVHGSESSPVGGEQPIASALGEEMQILRVYSLLQKCSLVKADSVNDEFATTLKRRCSQLTDLQRNYFLIISSLAGVRDTISAILPDGLPEVQIALKAAVSNKNWERVSSALEKLSPVIKALAIGLPEFRELLSSYQSKLATVADNFDDLKESLLRIYDIPIDFRNCVIESTEYQDALRRCRKAGELPDSWDLHGLLEDNNNNKRDSSRNTLNHDASVESIVHNGLSRKTLDTSLIAHFQDFLDSTWMKKWSRDRKGDPWGEDVPSSFKVQEVVQVMNMKSWQDYLEVKRTLGKCSQVLKDIDVPLTHESGSKLTSSYPVVGGHLKHHLNEVWLWHGTKPMAANCIAANDFEISKAGSHRGTLYGSGIYLAESSTKADEYCRETNSQGWRSMLLCRCLMGKYFYIAKDTTGEECEQAVMKDKYNSVLGDRRKLRNSFREFVFYDHRQVYPCFLVFYERGDPIPHEPKPKAKS